MAGSETARCRIRCGSIGHSAQSRFSTKRNGRFETFKGDKQTLVFVGCQQWFATPGRQSKLEMGDAVV